MYILITEVANLLDHTARNPHRHKPIINVVSGRVRRRTEHAPLNSTSYRTIDISSARPDRLQTPPEANA